MGVIFRIVCTLLLLAGISSCKAEQPAHPAEARAGEFLDALKYGDATRAASLHLESTNQGFYCQSDKFAQILELARSKRSEAECQRLSKAKDDHLDELSPEARLLVQIVRFSCAHPEGDCAAYGERVLRSYLAVQLEASTFRWRTDDWTIRKVIGDDNEAVAYVDLNADPAQAEPVQSDQGQKAAYETLEMRRVDDQWFVAASFVDDNRLLDE